MQHGALIRVGRVPPHAPLTTVQQPGQCLAVMDIRRGGRHGVNELALAIDTEMGLHPEIPLPAFLGLMHLGIPRAGREGERGAMTTSRMFNARA